MNFGVANFDVWDGSVSPLATRGRIAAASLGLRLGIAARSLAFLVDRDTSYAGRCQVGEQLSFEVQTIGLTRKSSGTSRPDRVPVARVYLAAGGLKHIFPIPIDRSSSGSIGVFRVNFRPGPTDPLGRYYALFHYLTAGLTRETIAVFECIQGGHRNGPVMTMSNFTQPAGASFIAHHEAGIVTRGLRPYLDSGD